jgi:hypothetical protein
MYLTRIFPLADDAMLHDENKLTPAEPHALAEAVALLCGSSKDASAPATLTPSGPFLRRNALYAIWTAPASSS